MAEDAATGTLFLVVLDGHGEAGDKVAQVSVNGFQRLFSTGFFFRRLSSDCVIARGTAALVAVVAAKSTATGVCAVLHAVVSPTFLLAVFYGSLYRLLSKSLMYRCACSRRA
jgi:hypothetical protein